MRIRLHGTRSIQALSDQERRIQIELGKQDAAKIGRSSPPVRLQTSLDGYPQDQWPGDVPWLLGVPPFDAKLIDYLFQGIAGMRSDEPLRRRPRFKIAEQMIEISLRCHLNFGASTL